MSESKQQWTPGPWMYSRWDESGTRFYIAQQEGAPYTPDYSDVATLVAETCSGERVARQEANAKLISAAPELVEAARIGLQYIEAVCFNTPNPKKRANYADAASKIRAALAKAGA